MNDITQFSELYTCVFGPCQGDHLRPIPVSVDDRGCIHLAVE